MYYNNVLYNQLRNKFNIIFKNSVPTSRKAKCVPNTKTKRLLRFKGIMGVYYEIRKKYTNTHCRQTAEISMLK
jgi:hypothetical protein